jgi:transcriptional regulator with XRE-family HTH domain
LLSSVARRLTLSRLEVKIGLVPDLNPEAAVETVGERLRRLRLDRGLSQRQLAEPGISYAYISRIEGGARRPSVKALRKLARKLGVSADYLETGSEIRESDVRELQIADAELELRLAKNPDEAEARLVSLREEAVAAGDGVGAARAEIALGLAAAATGRNSEAIGRLEAGLDLSPTSPAARPDVFATLGHAYAASGKPERAVEVFESCLAELADVEPRDPSAQVRFATYLSYALTDLGDLTRAQAVLDDVLEQAESLADGYTRVRLFWSLARLNDVRGRHAAALDYIRRAMALLEATDDTIHLARAHLLCADILIAQGRIEEAGPHFDRAERLFGPSAQTEDLVNLHRDRARREAMLGHGEKAIEQARAALELAGDEYPHERGHALWALAEGHALTDDFAGADDAYRQAAVLLDGHGHRRDVIGLYRSWAKFLRRCGREQDALEVLERATDLASEPVTAEAPAKR